MNTIIVTNQQELDALPSKFETYTTIEIRSSTTVVVLEALGNSSVEARGNSSVEAWDNSSVELMICAHAVVVNSKVVVKKLLDYSTALFRGCPENIVEKSETATSKVVPLDFTTSFEEWLRRGYVYADGITKKLKSQKKIGEIEVYECENFPKKSSSYVVKKGELFSHGDTVEKAIEDLRYKIGNRNTAEFESWRDVNKVITLDEAITGYRVITGACEFGVKEFVKSKTFEEKLTPKMIVELTVGQFGNEKLSEFLAAT